MQDSLSSLTRKRIVTGRVFGFVCLGTTLLLGLPFAGSGTVDWDVMGGRVLAGTLLTALVSFSHAVAAGTLRNALLLLVLTLGISWGAEVAGVRWGAPFGCTYQYHGALRPFLWGGVPLIIPAAWYVLLRFPLILMDGWDIRSKADGRPEPGPLHLKAAVCGAYMAGCGLLLDPLGAVTGAWVWSDPAGFMAVQVENALGWMLIGYIVASLYFWLMETSSRCSSRWILKLNVDIIIASIIFQSLALVTVANRVQSWLPALASMLVMIPAWWVWFACQRRSGGNAAGG